MVFSIINKLKQASKGLQFRSESDYPFEVFLWEGQAPATAKQILKQTGHPEDALVEVIDLQAFFQPATQEQDWYGTEQKATASRFQQLLDTIKTTLNNVQVYRVGTTEIDVYIVGTANNTDMVGLSTKVVET